MTKEFLQHIWPNQGLYCIAVPEKLSDGSGFFYKHFVCDTIDKAVNVARVTDNQNKDCFMAVGTLKERKVFNETRQKDEYRTHANMGWFKTLIFDIDIGEDKTYLTQKDALLELKKFIKDTQLPSPTIVSSGGGLHVYFTFESTIPADVWHKFSLRLKSIARHFKLAVDDSRTSDKSSVLRVVGTHNHKEEVPRPVKVLRYGKPTSVLDMKTAMDRVINFEKIELIVHKEYVQKELNDTQKLFAGIADNTSVFDKPDGEMILKKCNTLNKVRECGGYVSEGLWHKSLQVSVHLKIPIHHELSCGHPNFNEAQMNRKVDALIEKGIGPTLCSTFRELAPDWCSDCPHKVTSPISLGTTLRKSAPPVVTVNTSRETIAEAIEEEPETETVVEKIDAEDVVDWSGGGFGGSGGDDDGDQPDDDDDDDDDENEDVKLEETTTIMTEYGFQINLPNPPPPYERSDAGVYARIEDDEGGEGDLVEICPYDIYPYNILAEKSQAGMYTAQVEIKLPHKEIRRIDIPFDEVADSKLFNKALAQAGVLSDMRDAEQLVRYMKAYIKHLLKVTKTVHKYPQLGWMEDGDIFVLPHETLKKDGTKDISSVSDNLVPVVKSFRKKGTLEEWRKIIDVYARPNFEPYAFGHLVGYGSLLFRFTGHEGAIVNMLGNSGSGKTVVLKTINSIFGHPIEPMLTQSDTFLSKMDRLGIFNSMCVTYDEITNIEADELSTLCYAISQGRGRHRLTAAAQAKENHTKWQMILAASSNKGLMSTLSTAKHDSSAESFRVFEYRIDRMEVMSKDEATELFEPLIHNFGHAGEPFVNYVIQHSDEVRKLIKDYTLKFDKAANVPIPERYWSSIVACVLTGGHIGNKLNLCNFDLDKLFDWSVKQIKEMRGIVVESSRDSKALLVEFLNLNHANTLTTEDREGAKNGYVVTQEPRIKLLVRTDSTGLKSYIDVQAIRQYVVKGGGDFNKMRSDLTESGILLNPDAYKTLSAGSSGSLSGRSRCWMVDLSHPDMQEGIKLPDSLEKKKNVVQLGAVDKDEVG